MLYMQFGGGGIASLFNSELFLYVLPWLFVFAVVYGILSHTNGGIPKSNAARAVISFVTAFSTMPVAPFITARLTQLSTGFTIAVSGLLVFVILIELLGVKSGKDVYMVDQNGKAVGRQSQPASIFEAHGKAFAVLVILVAGLIFAGSGGMQMLGINSLPSLSPASYSMLFFVLVTGAITAWLVNEKKEGL